jgi:hypothetical protein
MRFPTRKHEKKGVSKLGAVHPRIVGAGRSSVGQGFQPAGFGSILLPVQALAILFGAPSNHSRQGCRENRQPGWPPDVWVARRIVPPNHIGIYQTRWQSRL